MRLASDALKGTSWEPIFFAAPTDLSTRKELKAFRDACDRDERPAPDYAALARNSQAFIAQVKRQRARGQGEPEGAA